VGIRDNSFLWHLKNFIRGGNGSGETIGTEQSAPVRFRAHLPSQLYHGIFLPERGAKESALFNRGSAFVNRGSAVKCVS
jgi:hypothetical protein